MVSSKKIIIALFVILAVALIGICLEVAGINKGRYLIYIAVPIGALVTMFSALLAVLGKTKDDI